MRVLSGVLMLVLLGGSHALAQEASWGVKGGVNLATLSSDQDPGPEFKYRIGFIAGGFFTWPLGGRLDLQPELLFSQQGATFDATGLDAITIQIDSLVAPILVRYKLRPSGGGLVVFAGPSLGFALTAKVRVEAGGETTKDDISDDIKSVDYGVVFGAGWQAGRLSIDGRYTWGLSSIAVDDDLEKTRHRVIAVLAGVRF
jgi:outer membrane protein with beta-barrel domain